MKYKLAMLVCRVAPLHNEHKRTMDYGLEIAENLLIIKGSSDESRTIKNPWNFFECAAMINSSYPPAKRNRILIRSAIDFPGENERWVEQIKNIIKEVKEENPEYGDEPIALLGGAKKEWYFDMLLQCGVKREEIPEFHPLNATEVRECYFRGGNIKDMVPYEVNDILTKWKQTEDYIALKEKYIITV